jgi:hypothetical protein
VKELLVRTKSAIIILLLFFLLHFNPAIAQNELSDAQIQERLQAIQQILEQGTSNANLWWYGWLIGYSTATIGQGVVYATSADKETRQDMALGAATTFLGAMGQVIAPMTPGTAADLFKTIAGSTPQERADKLLAAEKLLQQSASREIAGTSWQTHAVTGVVNLSSGLIVWLGFKRNIWEGVGNFALNTVITEAQIWTQPTRAIKDYDDYIRKYDTAEKPGCLNSGMSWSIAVYPGGLGISIIF